jgi:hypothetical protein
MVLVRGPHYDGQAGITVIDFSIKLEAPVAGYYRTHLAEMGLPMQVTAAELQPRLLAAGINIPQALADIGSRLTPAESALLGTTLATPVPLRYFFKVDAVVSIEPKTGALIAVDSKQEGVEVQPDLSGATALQPLLDKYADIPSVRAVSDGLAKLAQSPPQPAQLLEWRQTPASSRHMAGIARDQGRMMTIVTWWVPLGLAGLGAALVVFGVIGRRRAGRGRPGATMERGAPPAPQTPVVPSMPPLEPVGAPNEPGRVPEPV